MGVSLLPAKQVESVDNFFSKCYRTGCDHIVLYSVFMSQQVVVERLSLPNVNQRQDICILACLACILSICHMILNSIYECLSLYDYKRDTDIPPLSDFSFFPATNHLCERKASSVRKVLPEQQRLH